MSEGEETDIASLSSQFEAIKIAMTQDKNGHVLKLSIHPNDTPESIMRDMVGTRYMVVLVRIGDEGQAVPAKVDEEGRAAVKMAAMLCADRRFQTWLVQSEMANDVSEDEAINAVRKHCGVRSRSELKINSTARATFLALRDEFADNLRRGIVR